MHVRQLFDAHGVAQRRTLVFAHAQEQHVRELLGRDLGHLRVQRPAREAPSREKLHAHDERFSRFSRRVKSHRLRLLHPRRVLLRRAHVRDVREVRAVRPPGRDRVAGGEAHELRVRSARRVFFAKSLRRLRTRLRITPRDRPVHPPARATRVFRFHLRRAVRETRPLVCPRSDRGETSGGAGERAVDGLTARVASRARAREGRRRARRAPARGPRRADGREARRRA